MEFQSISNAFFLVPFSQSHVYNKYTLLQVYMLLLPFPKFLLYRYLFFHLHLSLSLPRNLTRCMLYLFTFLYLEAYFWSSWMNECTKNYFASKNFRRYICVEILNLSCILYNWLLDFLKLKVHGFQLLCLGFDSFLEKKKRQLGIRFIISKLCIAIVSLNVGILVKNNLNLT